MKETAKELSAVGTETATNAIKFGLFGGAVAWGINFLRTIIPASTFGIMLPGVQIGLITAGVIGAVGLIGALLPKAG